MSVATPESEELPENIRLKFSKFSSGDWWFTGACFAIALIVQHRTNVLGFGSVAIVWFALMNGRDNGRYWYLAWLFLANRYSRYFKHGIQAKSKEVGSDQDALRPKKPARAPTAIPFEVNWIPSPSGGRTGVLHTTSNTDSVVFEAEGSDIASRNLPGQAEGYDAMAEMTADAASQQRSLRIGVSYIFRRDVFNRAKLEDDLSELYHPEAVFPASLLDEPATAAASESQGQPPEELSAEEQAAQDEAGRWEFLSQIYNELTDMTAETACEVKMATVVTIHREGILAKAEKTRKIRQRDIRRLPINRVIDSVDVGLRNAGVYEPYPLDEGQLHSFVRGAWDKLTIPAYYQELVENPAAAWDKRLHWPVESLLATPNSSITDGTHAAVMRIRRLPKFAWQGIFRELISGVTAPHCSVALIGEAARSNLELRGLETGAAVIEDLLDLVGVERRTRNMEARQKRLEARGDAIFESGFSQDYSILIAVFGDSGEEIDEYCEDVENHAKSLKMRAKRIEGEELQYPALWSATLGLNLL